MLRKLLAAVLPDRVKAAAWNLLEFFREHVFRPYVIRKNIDGVAFNLLIPDPTAQRWYDNDVEWPEMRFIKERLAKPGDVVFECGGHQGCTALFLAACVGAGGKVVTFEPGRENASVIETNVRLNGVNNIIVEQKAVGAGSGKGLVLGLANTCVASSHRQETHPRGRQEVDLVPLDDYAKEHNLYPTLIKIDVEGYEMEVLKGARQLLERRPKLAIEIHSPSDLARYGASAVELLKLLDLDRYECWIQRYHFDTPTAFDVSQPIDTRVHLYAVPRADA
jgi:FkbM family methyltransferase